MPIVARPPGADHRPPTHLVGRQRPGDDASDGALLPSSGVLLPAGDALAPAPALTPARALALDALRLIRRLGDADRRPERWSTAAFSREVDLVRRHLAPLRTRAALAGSYGREAFHRAPDRIEDDDPGPVRVAYAVRWLELGPRDAQAAHRAAAVTSPGGPSARSPRRRPGRIDGGRHLAVRIAPGDASGAGSAVVGTLIGRWRCPAGRPGAPSGLATARRMAEGRGRYP